MSEEPSNFIKRNYTYRGAVEMVYAILLVKSGMNSKEVEKILDIPSSTIRSWCSKSKKQYKVHQDAAKSILALYNEYEKRSRTERSDTQKLEYLKELCCGYFSQENDLIPIVPKYRNPLVNLPFAKLWVILQLKCGVREEEVCSNAGVDSATMNEWLLEDGHTVIARHARAVERLYYEQMKEEVTVAEKLQLLDEIFTTYTVEVDTSDLQQLYEMSLPSYPRNQKPDDVQMLDQNADSDFAQGDAEGV